MNRFTVNGNERDWPLAREKSLLELLEHIQRSFNTESSLVSRIRVNGLELSEREEQSLGALPISQLKTLEIFTAHPREVAEETLQNLLEFTRHLEAMARQAADELGTPEFERDFARLIDGVSTFTDGVTHARRILRVTPAEKRLTALTVLEADLLSVMRDVLHYRRAGDGPYLAELLREHLTANIAAWREDGIPALIRLRDS
jgi:hypothetical protein